MNFKIKIIDLLLFLIFGFSNTQITLFAQKELPADFCISVEESELFNLINDYRKAMKLPAIPMSKSLSFTANKHIQDLIQNKPDTSTCNLHSWSNKGSWTPCCYQKEKDDKLCMKSKPTEITMYPGTAYEIIYWESKEATPDMAFNQWREISASQSVIINTDKWEN